VHESSLSRAIVAQVHPDAARMLVSAGTGEGINARRERLIDVTSREREEALAWTSRQP
jgi:hypothetical protein